jgi:hypothetical protein
MASEIKKGFKLLSKIDGKREKKELLSRITRVQIIRSSRKLLC